MLRNYLSRIIFFTFNNPILFDRSNRGDSFLFLNELVVVEREEGVSIRVVLEVALELVMREVMGSGVCGGNVVGSGVDVADACTLGDEIRSRWRIVSMVFVAVDG